MKVSPNPVIRPANQRIAQIRGILGLGIADFAELLGVHRNTYRSWEEGKTNVGIEAVMALSLKGWNANWILTGEGPERLPDPAHPRYRVADSGLMTPSQSLATTDLKQALRLASEALDGKMIAPDEHAKLVTLIFELLAEGLPEAKVLHFARTAS